MSTSGLGELLADGRRNAAASWLFVAVAAAAWIGGVIVAGPLWSVFALAVVVLAVLPPIVYRSRYVMLPWEVLAMASLPLIGLAIGAQRLSGPLFAYLAIAAVGLVIVVELDSFTSIRSSPAFALVLVVAATMAASATWQLLQWYASILLDRSYDMTNDELMIEFVYATLAGFGAGGLFWAYFRRIALTDRVPIDIQDQVAQSPSTDDAQEGNDV
ncbi:hypothetical protein [Salinarchaeum laminariae]|uniref:hypothetical protein n=1 Tax=Salinarchaeum laminariae TaxID=869888 RepID=UPI0020BDA9B8|nr:hypothetical protein [Salinarchaeum laminariae]